MIGPSQKPIPDKTQHSQETDIHARGKILTGKPAKQAVADPRLRHCGHRDKEAINTIELKMRKKRLENCCHY
jgi:hypothetical protein